MWNQTFSQAGDYLGPAKALYKYPNGDFAVGRRCDGHRELL
jgi:hypothetical protein